MEYSYKEVNGVGVYALKGTLLGETDGMQLAEEVNEHLEDGIKGCVLDISDLKHINSSGLGVFITLLTRTRKKGGELALLNPSEFISNLLMITKLNSIFDIYEDLGNAVDAVKKKLGA